MHLKITTVGLSRIRSTKLHRKFFVIIEFLYWCVLSLVPLLFSCRKLLVYLQKLVASIATKNSELGFKLYLESALIADKCAFINMKNKVTTLACDFNGIAYEFMAQAFILYEDEITDSKVQYRAITSVVGTLIASRSFVNVDYESLATKVTQYAAKLVKKPDQCKMIILCSHLFYRGNEAVSFSCVTSLR